MADKVKIGNEELELTPDAVIALIARMDRANKAALKELADSNSQIGDKAKAFETRAEKAERELTEVMAKLAKPADTIDYLDDDGSGGKVVNPVKFAEWQQKHDLVLLEKVKNTLAPEIANIRANAENVNDETMKAGIKNILGEGASDDDVNTAVQISKTIGIPALRNYIATNLPNIKLADIPIAELSVILKEAFVDGKYRVSEGKRSARVTRDIEEPETDKAKQFSETLKELGFSDRDVSEAKVHIKETKMTEEEYLKRMQGQSGGHKRNE